MTIILGLAGQARSGKDSVADYLVSRYGAVKFSFSDALYAEVCQAYGLEDESLLRDAKTKDVPQSALALEHCRDYEFVATVVTMADRATNWERNPYVEPLSPRQVLQWWGTEYRRAQDPDYWVKRAADFVWNVQHASPYPEHAPQFFVNTSVRFENERKWVHEMGGTVWHLRRRGIDAVNQHASEVPLEVWEGERELWNNDTLDRLWYGVDLLMTTTARFVRVEPMEDYHAQSFEPARQP